MTRSHSTMSMWGIFQKSKSWLLPDCSLKLFIFVSVDLNHNYVFINGFLPSCERELCPSHPGMVFIVKSIIWEKEVGLGHCYQIKLFPPEVRATHGRDEKRWAAGISIGKIFESLGISITWLWMLSYGKITSHDHKEIIWSIGCQDIFYQ